MFGAVRPVRYSVVAVAELPLLALAVVVVVLGAAMKAMS